MSKKRRPPGSVGAAEFKARCLELVDRVKESRTDVIITRHGHPVARLVPIAPEAPASPVGSMAGSVLRYDAPFDPIPGAWSVNEPDEP
jgi:prevent-host-death family protein